MEKWTVIDEPKIIVEMEVILIIKPVMGNGLNHTVTTLLGNHQISPHCVKEIVLN